MNVLITSSRFPHALGEIRRFGEQGHTVFATDTFDGAPGSHSRFVAERFVTASPTFDTDQFIDDIEAIIISHKIDLLVPAFEECLYLAEHMERLSALTEVFCPPLETLIRLHDKSQFVELAKELGMPVPITRVARSDEELRAAIAEIPEYFARACFSRGGVKLLTNTGPLAGRVAVEDCHPTEDSPWLVQEFLRGVEVCTFSIARNGKLTGHVAYEHPKTIEHAGGILFESVDEPESVMIARTFVEALGYHGQISFDFVRTSRGLVLIECNPRPTAGVFMMPSQAFGDAIFGPVPSEPYVAPAGAKAQIAIAIVRDMFRDWRAIPADLKILFSGIDDAYTEKGDAMPGLYCLLAYSRITSFRNHVGRTHAEPTDIMSAQFFDVAWDGARVDAARAAA